MSATESTSNDSIAQDKDLPTDYVPARLRLERYLSGTWEDEER